MQKILGTAGYRLRPGITLLVALAGAGLPLQPLAFTAEQEAWFDSDDEAAIARVNEGELAFLPSAPERPVHHHSNHIVLSPGSFDTGWADIRQCHRDLDVTGRVEIVFSDERTRGLRITEARGIGRAWIENSTVQLSDVSTDASLCVALESRIVHTEDNGEFSVRNGPYMRRFLDGYYPMHVDLEVEYPCAQLQLASVDPLPQPGFSITEDGCRLFIDAWFEGRLKTDLRFRNRSP